MKPEHSRLREEQRSEVVQSQTVSSEGKVFSGAEEVLRADSELNPVPPEVAERLNQAIAAEPQPQSSWWKKIFQR